MPFLKDEDFPENTTLGERACLLLSALTPYLIIFGSAFILWRFFL